VGGVKEKVLAAHRAGIQTVLLPEKCRKDLVEVPDEVKRDLQFQYVSRMTEVLDTVLGASAIEGARAALRDRRQAKPVEETSAQA
jgi:ATP-dependent Lon protease